MVCERSVHGVVVYATERARLAEVFERQPSLNLAKFDFGELKVTYLDKHVRH